MKINICSTHLPPVDKPYRVWCFMVNGFLTRDHRFTSDFDSAMVFYSADEFNSLNPKVFYDLVNQAIGPLNPDSFPFSSSIEANVFVQFI